MKSYFISDVHLGLRVGDYEGRERRLVSFLQSLPRDTEAVYLLGDIWDFWYEYRDVVPKGYVRVFAALSTYTFFRLVATSLPTLLLKLLNMRAKQK